MSTVGFDVGDCCIVGHIHRYLIECYRCLDWYALERHRDDAIDMATMHNKAAHPLTPPSAEGTPQ